MGRMARASAEFRKVVERGRRSGRSNAGRRPNRFVNCSAAVRERTTVTRLEKTAQALDTIITCWIVTTLAIMVLTIVSDVILRESLDSPLVWNLEVAQSALINITYVGAALAFRRRAHISINVVTARLPLRVERWVEVVARCLVLPFIGVLTYSGLLVIQHARGVTPTLRLPIWMYYFPIFIGSVLLFFYAVLQIVEAIQAARCCKEPGGAGAAPRGAI